MKSVNLLKNVIIEKKNVKIGDYIDKKYNNLNTDLTVTEILKNEDNKKYLVNGIETIDR